MKKWGKADKEEWCGEPPFAQICPPEGSIGFPVCIKHMKESSRLLWKNKPYIPVVGMNRKKCKHTNTHHQ